MSKMPEASHFTVETLYMRTVPLDRMHKRIRIKGVKESRLHMTSVLNQIQTDLSLSYCGASALYDHDNLYFDNFMAQLSLFIYFTVV